MIRSPRGWIFPLLLAAVDVARAQRPATDSATRAGTVSLPGVRVLETRREVDRLAGSVSTIDQRTLQLSRVFTTHEALRKLPGIHVRDEEGLGLRPNIGIRGLNPTRSTKVLLLEDGVPITMAPYGDNATYYHPPIDRIASVEIVKGAGQILHGPQTIGGVINYLTPDIPVRPQGTVIVSQGTRGVRTGHASYGGTFGPSGLLFDVVRKQGEGARANTDTDLRDASLKVLVPLSEGQSLAIRGNWFTERSRVTYSGLTEAEYAADPLQNPFRNDRMALARGGLAMTHRAGHSELRRLTTTAYAHTVSRDWWRQSSNSTQRPNDRSDPVCGGMANLLTTCGVEGRLRNYVVRGVESRGSMITVLGSWQARVDAGVRAHYEQQERLQVNGDFPTSRSAGASSNANSGVVEDNRRTTRGLAGWTVVALTRGDWTVTPGSRWEHISLSRTNRRPTAGHPTGIVGQTSLLQWIPGVGVSHRVADGVTAFAGAHRGFAPPRPEDAINNSTGGVVELDPELSWNSEVGLRWRVRDGHEFGLTGFHMAFANQVIPASVAGGTGATLTSAGKSDHLGAELSFRLTPEPHTGRRVVPIVEASATWVPVARFSSERYAYVGTSGTDVPGKVYQEQNALGSRERRAIRGNRLPYAPLWMGALTVGVRAHPGVDVRVEAVHTARQFGDPLNTAVTVADGQQGMIPAVVIVNATATIPVRSPGLSAFVAVKNLADRRYIVDRTRGLLPGAPRMIQVGASSTLFR